MTRTITIDQTAVDAVAYALAHTLVTPREEGALRQYALFLLNAAYTAQNGDDLATLRDLAAQMNEKEDDQ